MIEWLYCYLPTPEAVHPINWREEAEAAEECDFVCHSFDMERFLDGDVEGALEHLPNGGGRTLGYRGWLLKEDEYRSLEDEVASHGYSLLTGYNDLEGREEHFSQFAHLGERIASDFFVADVARTQSSKLVLIEINDGGTAGLPPALHPIEFYSTVAEAEEGRTEDDESLSELD